MEDAPAGIIRRLKVQVILPRPKELKWHHTHANYNLTHIAAFPNYTL